jgi:hypothetical protein
MLTNNTTNESSNILATTLLALAFFNSGNYACGQNAYYNPPAALSGKTVIIPAGTTFEGRLESTIGSSVSRNGEQFTIEMTAPALANASDVLIPAGARILGEVVEAVPSSKVTHIKKEKPFGKLRIQITALKMPDGTTFPMVGSLVGENTFQGSGHNPDLGGGIAYTGSSPNFEAVSPARMAKYQMYQNMRGRGRGVPMSSVVTKNQMMADPILGKAGGSQQGDFGIRSLVRKNRNLVIYKGSPLTVRLDSPFKMGIGVARNAATGLEAPVNPDADDYPGSGHRRFSPSAPPEANDASTAGGPDPLASILGKKSAAPTPPTAAPPSSPGSQPTGTAPAPSTPLPFQVPNRTPQGNSQDSNF